MGRQASIDWESLRKDYEEVGLNPAACGIKYNCSAATVYQRVRAEGWRRPIEDDEIDTEFMEDEDAHLNIDEALYEQKRYLRRLMKELDASTSKPGQMKQWIKEGTAGNIDSRRKAMYQVLTMGNRMIMLKNAAQMLKTIVETENMVTVPKGKKAQAEAAAQNVEDDRFDWDTPKAA